MTPNAFEAYQRAGMTAWKRMCILHINVDMKIDL